MGKTRKTFREVQQTVRTPEAIARVEQRVTQTMFEMDIKAMREMLGLTQTEVAQLTEMSQPEISMLEARSDHKLSTLRKVVSALGGQLNVIATFGDKSVRLRSA
jgi:DNA-binding XRE family transcriptional regulator